MTWKQRHIKGWPLITRHMMDVLERLADGRWSDCADVHAATLAALEKRDWIMAFDNGTCRYRITGRGVKAMRFFQQPVKQYRDDGLCPDCGERERHTWPNGKTSGYCLPCHNKRGRKKGRQLNPDNPCSRCGKRKRHIQQPSGKAIAYCKQCERIVRRGERRRKHRRKLAAIRRGEVITCCKCDQPVLYSDKVVYDYCYDHYREYQRRWRLRAAFEKNGLHP